VFDSWEGKEIYLIPTASRPALGPTQLPIQMVPGTSSPGVKRPAREADHSTPSSADVTKSGAVPPLPESLHGVVLN
jgi:hypothetical protein